MFQNCEGQSHKAVSTDTTFEEKGQPKQIRTEVPLLTVKPAHSQQSTDKLTIQEPALKQAVLTKWVSAGASPQQRPEIPLQV